MQAPAFLMKMRQHGGNLLLDGDSFRYRGDKKALTPKVRAYIDGNRTAIREYLLSEQAEREQRRADFATLLAPYEDLIVLAERGALPASISVGFSGRDVALSSAVLAARDWLLLIGDGPPDDPFAPDLQAESLRVLKTIRQYVAAETRLLETEAQEQALRAGQEVLTIRCDLLGGEEICLTADDVDLTLDADGLYCGKVVYKVSELQRLRESQPSPDALRTIHAVKQTLGGDYEGVRPE